MSFKGGGVERYSKMCWWQWFLRGKNSTILNLTVQIKIITRMVKCLKVNCGWNVTSNWIDGIRLRLAKKWKITDCCICIFTRTCLHDNKGVLVELSCALCQQWAGLWQNEEAVCADTIDALCSNTLEADHCLVMYHLMLILCLQCSAVNTKHGLNYMLC